MKYKVNHNNALACIKRDFVDVDVYNHKSRNKSTSHIADEDKMI